MHYPVHIKKKKKYFKLDLCALWNLNRENSYTLTIKNVLGLLLSTNFDTFTSRKEIKHKNIKWRRHQQVPVNNNGEKSTGDKKEGKSILSILLKPIWRELWQTVPVHHFWTKRMDTNGAGAAPAVPHWGVKCAYRGKGKFRSPLLHPPLPPPTLPMAPMWDWIL